MPIRPALLAFMMTSSSLPAHAEPKSAPQRPEPERLGELARTQSYTLGRPFQVRLTPDGAHALFLRASASDPTADLFILDRATGRARRLLSARDLLDGKEETLSVAEKALRERKRIKTRGFTELELSPTGTRVVLELDGRLFLHELASGRSAELELPEGTILTPRLSPDDRRLAFVLDHDLVVASLPEVLPERASLTPPLHRLTVDGSEDQPNGVAEFVAQEEMSRFEGFWWSPDGKQLLYQKNDHRGMERFTIADAAHPERPPANFPYPRAGKQNVKVRLFAVRVDGLGGKEIDWDRDAFPYIAKVVWPARGPLVLLAQARDQRSQVLLRVDLEAGGARPLFEERDDAWLNIHDSTPRFFSDGRSFLWATEEGGAWRLERKHLAEDGLSITRREVLLDQDAHFHALAHLDETRGLLWYLGGADPATLQLYRARIEGGRAPEPVTTGETWTEATFAHGGSAVALTVTSLRSMPETRVHAVDAAGGLGPPAPIPHEAEQPSTCPHVELVAEGDAGGFRAAILRPTGFDPARRYPVIVYAYGGPGFSLVKAQMAGWFMHQWLADHGFVVVSLDGRGTPRRGRTFERALRQRFHEVPLDDQVAGLRSLAGRFPEIDLERVGIYGWSFGGYLAALAVLRRPDVFKVGVAGAPVADWLYYDTHYTERYLGVPQSSEDPAYVKASLLTYAHELAQPLLLLHGVADDNVYFAHTLQLANALFRAKRPFELVPLVGLTHQVADASIREALFHRVVEFFGQRLW